MLLLLRWDYKIQGYLKEICPDFSAGDLLVAHCAVESIKPTFFFFFPHRRALFLESYRCDPYQRQYFLEAE